MDSELVKRIKARMPKFNPSICNGLAVEHMMTVDPDTGKNTTMAYIDRCIHTNQPLFPEGLVYEGSKMCTPYKHFEKLTQEYCSKRTPNIADHDTYLAEYHFSYKGVKLIPKYVQLPFVRRGGLIRLNGALYRIAPVITDIGYSVGRGTIFIPFRRTKYTFNRTSQHLYVNGKLDIIHVVWCRFHNEINNRKRSDLDNRKWIETCLPQYFFCRFGVKETFKQWGGADIRVGLRKDFPLSQFPKSEYVVYESANLKSRHPAGELCLVLPRSQETDFTRTLVGGFFYVMDQFADRFTLSPDLAREYTLEQLVCAPKLWQVILGHMVFGDFKHQGKVLENILVHLEGFEHTLDDMTREDLAEVNVKVNTIWELLYEIQTSLSHHFYQTDNDETSMYNKRLTVLRYVMEEFNYAISMFAHSFQGKRDKEWTVDELNDALDRSFKLNAAMRKLTVSHNELETVNYPGDNMIFKITSVIVPQDSARSSGAHSRGMINDTSRLLHVSLSEVCQYKNQPKTSPDGRGRIEPTVELTVDGKIQRSEKFYQLTEETQRRITS